MKVAQHQEPGAGATRCISHVGLLRLYPVNGLILSAYGYSWGDLSPNRGRRTISVLACMARRTIATLVDTAPRAASKVTAIASKTRRRRGRVRARAVGQTTFAELTVAVSRTLPLDRVGALKRRHRRVARRCLASRRW